MIAERGRQAPTGSLVVDAQGKPLLVFRGEHGAGHNGEFQSRLGSLSFTDERAIAEVYANEPNDFRMDRTAVEPRVIEAYLDIRNPFINNPDDPFLELGRIEEVLGRDEAVQAATEFSSDIANTGNWQEDIDAAGKYGTPAQFVRDHPDRVGELYFDAYRLLDSPEWVAKLKAKGFDGAIHVGNGESGTAIEYKVFDASQVKRAPQAVEERPAPAIAEAGTQLTRDDVTAGQRGRDVAELVAAAVDNQAELGATGDAIARETGAEFKNPGPKAQARVEEKIATEGYDDAGEILDYARGAFVVDTAEQADTILARLLERHAVFDKGWKRLGSGYYDRKLIVQFANGGTAEVQIVPRAIWDYRKAGGHKLYNEARAPGTAEARVAELNAEMAAGYDAALGASSFSQDGGSGTFGNSAEKPATSSGAPSTGALDTSPGADAQAPAARDQANALRSEPEPTTATGRDSTSNNRTTDIDSTPAADMGEAAPVVNGAVTWDAPETVAAIAAHNQQVASRPSSQESLAGSTNGSEPRSSSGSAGKSSAEGGAEKGTQPSPRADSPRVPASDETTRAGFPAQRTNEAIISPPDERAALRGSEGLDLAGGRVNPATGARSAEMAQLSAKSPMRSIADQEDVDGLALFDRARSPELFAIGERVDDEGKAKAELRTAEDLLAELDADDAAIAAIERCLV